MAEMDKDSDNFFRLVKLIVDVSSEVLRDVLLHMIKPKTLENVLQTCRPIIDSKRKIWFDNEYKVLTEKHPNSDEFDITLLVKIFRNLFPSICPNDMDIGLKDEIQRMSVIRNSIYAHVKSTKVTDDEFRLHWANITATITRAADHGSPGMKQRVVDKIDTIRTENLKSSSLESLLEVFRAWHEEDKKEFENIKRQLKQQGDETKTMLSEQFKELDTKVQGILEKGAEETVTIVGKDVASPRSFKIVSDALTTPMTPYGDAEIGCPSERDTEEEIPTSASISEDARQIMSLDRDSSTVLPISTPVFVGTTSTSGRLGSTAAVSTSFPSHSRQSSVVGSLETPATTVRKSTERKKKKVSHDDVTEAQFEVLQLQKEKLRAQTEKLVVQIKNIQLKNKKLERELADN